MKASLRTRRILTVDIGNTAVKVAVFEGERLVYSVVGNADPVATVEGILTYTTVYGICCCSVAGDVEEIGERLKVFGLPVVCLTADLPIPIHIRYASRKTLGADRVAAAAGIAGPGRSWLLVDAGTAVTIDMVAGMVFEGGNISPGLRLRFRSLNEFTSRLPLVGPEGELPRFGVDTETAIRAGVVRGLAGELETALREARTIIKNTRMVLTGGDAALIAPVLTQRGVRFKVDCEALGRGLVRIFNYNN